MVTGTSPCRLTRITLLPEELLQALLALLSPDSTSGGGGNRKGHLLMSMPSKATTTRTGKGVNLNQNNKNSGTLALPTPSLSAKHLRAGEPVSSLRSLLFSASIKAWTVLVVCSLSGELSVTCRFGLGTVRLLSAGLSTLPSQVLHHLQQGRALQLQGLRGLLQLALAG